ncbi:tRNA methyltransferase tyw3 [Tyrophagus putrescentiae]|nr:tRNA methyltransferase tyw3 [Tyrophagus putrescentiae]
MYNYRPAKRGHQQPHQQQHQQPGKQFANEKRQALVQKLDRSRKGELDELVQPLCDLINADARYYTTSSCSGRLTLCGLKKKKREEVKDEEEDEVLEEGEKKKEKTRQQLLQPLRPPQGGPLRPGDHQLAEERHVRHALIRGRRPQIRAGHLPRPSGGPRGGHRPAAGGPPGGISKFGHRHRSAGATEHSSCIVALRHTLQMAVPVVVCGVKVTPDEYIHELVNVANGKFAANEAAIARLEADIRAKLYTAPLPNEPQANDGKEQQADQQVDALKEEEDGRPADQVPADDERTEEREEAICKVEHRSGAMCQPHVAFGEGQNGGPHCGEAGAEDGRPSVDQNPMAAAEEDREQSTEDGQVVVGHDRLRANSNGDEGGGQAAQGVGGR